MRADIQRVAVLYSRLAGYMESCLRTLKEHYGVELLVVRRPSTSQAPFKDDLFSWIDELHDRSTLQSKELLALLKRFGPQVVYMAGWLDRSYLQVARALKKQGVFVVAGTDTQWAGSIRQRIGGLIAPWYLHTAIDVLWVTGERQRQLAYRLGYTGTRCWEGVYACDWDHFARAYRAEHENRPRAFLYVGRYVAVKGIELLLQAYKAYRRQVDEPWPLICAGAGDQKSLLAGQEGVVDKGFVQPDQLPALMQEATTFVLPSMREPWGVVMQEAAAAGLLLLCSDACGAAVHLLRDGYNGFLFRAGDVQHLIQGMVRTTHASRGDHGDMARRSHQLSQQYTPRLWADTLMQGAASFQQQD